MKQQTFKYIITPSGHWTLWLRFFMSFLVNGVGFHILVHALPIQVSAQSTFIAVVFRSVGMMHLVDMDDSSGYMLRLEKEGNQPTEPPYNKTSQDDIAARAQIIVDDARALLDALAKEKKVM